MATEKCDKDVYAALQNLDSALLIDLIHEIGMDDKLDSHTFWRRIKAQQDGPNRLLNAVGTLPDLGPRSFLYEALEEYICGGQMATSSETTPARRKRVKSASEIIQGQATTTTIMPQAVLCSTVQELKEWADKRPIFLVYTGPKDTLSKVQERAIRNDQVRLIRRPQRKIIDPELTHYSREQLLAQAGIPPDRREDLKSWMRQHDCDIAVNDHSRKRIVFQTITVQGLGPVKDSITYSLDHQGVGWITVEDSSGFRANGFGKTTLSATAVLWCLTGELDDHVSGEEERTIDCLINTAAISATVKLEFTVNGEAYLLERCRRKRKLDDAPNSKVNKVRYTTPKGETTKCEEVQKQLCQLFLGREKPLTPKRLHAVLSQLFVWTPFSRQHMAAKLGVTASGLSLLLGSVAAVPASALCSASKAEVAKLTAELEEKTEQVKRLEQSLTATQKAVPDFQEETFVDSTVVESKRQRIQQLKDRLENEQESLRDKEEAVDIAQAEVRDAAVAEAQQQAEVTAAQVKLGEQQKARDAASEATCPLCTQAIDDEVRKFIQTRYEQAAAELEALTQRGASARAETILKDAALREAHRQYGEVKDKVDELTQRLQRHEKSFAQLQGAMTESQYTLDSQKSRMEELLNDLDEAEAARAQVEDDLRRANQRLEDLDALAKADSRSALDFIEHHCNSMLALLFKDANDKAMRAALSVKLEMDMTKAVNTNGSNEDKGIVDVGLYTALGACPAPATDSWDSDDEMTPKTPIDEDHRLKNRQLSTSEYIRVRLALFYAIRRLFTHQSGRHFNMVLFDECFLSLDLMSTLNLVVELSNWANADQLAIFVATVLPFQYLPIPKFRSFVSLKRGANNQLVVEQIVPSDGDDDGAPSAKREPSSE
eukprot:TRINITY_DN1744_c0_g1_i1.p1 TRINITY_DN1744_c0_g1~~TRINITY_DN1744_c0_g1_i1.p1  ORF type:complete len:886 (+),score=213.30 TRINITY_DN1744_c0_g1_i1:57-2714(+)